MCVYRSWGLIREVDRAVVKSFQGDLVRPYSIHSLVEAGTVVGGCCLYLLFESSIRGDGLASGLLGAARARVMNDGREELRKLMHLG